MPEPTPQLRETVLKLLTPRLERLGLTAADLEGDVSLLELGVVDSFGFLELVLDIEQETGIRPDLADLDPGEFSSLSGLTSFLERAAAGPH